MPNTYLASDWLKDVSGAFSAPQDWTAATVPDDFTTTYYAADIGGAGVTTGAAAFTVTALTSDEIDSLSIGAANATLAIKNAGTTLWVYSPPGAPKGPDVGNL